MPDCGKARSADFRPPRRLSSGTVRHASAGAGDRRHRHHAGRGHAAGAGGEEDRGRPVGPARGARRAIAGAVERGSRARRRAARSARATVPESGMALGPRCGPRQAGRAPTHSRACPPMRRSMSAGRPASWRCAPLGAGRGRIAGRRPWRVFASPSATQQARRPAPVDGPLSVCFDGTDVRATWRRQDGTLLELAEAQGLNPPANCRAGVWRLPPDPARRAGGPSAGPAVSAGPARGADLLRGAGLGCGDGPQDGLRYTSTGVVECVSTFWVWLPSTTAAMPRRPCEAMAIRSQPRLAAASMMA